MQQLSLEVHLMKFSTNFKALTIDFHVFGGSPVPPELSSVLAAIEPLLLSSLLLLLLLLLPVLVVVRTLLKVDNQKSGLR